MTVLFTDIVGSTELLGVLGEDGMERCRREHFGVLRRAVLQHGGREVKNVGDGIMAAFDRPSDGLRCAIAMQTAVAGQQLPGTRSLRIRVGLHSGPAIANEGDYWGTTVIVARRLCDVARAHEILTTQALAADAGADRGLVRELGGMTLKGLADEVGVCAVQWHGAPDDRADDAAPLRVGLPDALRAARGVVARPGELERLHALCGDAASGAGPGPMVLVSGPAGVGKTSLLAALGRRVHDGGAIVLLGRCDERIAMPFGPIADALRPLAAALPPARLRAQVGGWAPDLVRLLPELGERIGAVPRTGSDPDGDRHHMFQAVSQLLASTARECDVVLFVEDLQWADAGTIALLRHVAGATVAVVATVREGEHEPRLGAGWADAPERLRLGGLDVGQVGALIEADGGLPADPALAQAVHAMTSGNALHAGELARAWTQSGSIVVRDRIFVLAGAPAPHASDVLSVIERRVAGLPVGTRRVLTVGAVLGGAFSLALVERIFAADEPADLAAAIEVAVAERLLVRSPGGERLAFAHALIRQAVYARIGATRRGRLHRQVGDTIEDAAGSEGDDLVPELAYHFFRCAQEGRAAKAVEYALRAGLRSLDMLGHDRAAPYFAAALELLGIHRVPCGDELRVEATIGLGECQARAGDGTHRATLLDAARQAERIGDGGRLARAVLANGRGFFSMAGDVDGERVGMLRAALEACRDERSAVRARLLAQLAMELTYAGDRIGRLALSDEALAIARGLDEPATLVTVLYQRAATLWSVHELEQRLAALAEAERHVDALADPSLACHVFHQGAHAALAAADVALADRRLDALREHGAASGQPTLSWYEQVARCKRALCAGQVADAQRLAFAARDTGLAAGQPDASLWWALQMFTVRFLQGRLADIDYDAIPALTAQCPTIARFLDAQLACMQAAHGHERPARETLARLTANGFEEVAHDFAWIGTVALTGHACWQLADPGAAATVIGALAPWSEHLVDMGPAWLGSASHILGLLESTCARPAQASAHFARATAMHERCGARAIQAQTCLAWSELLRDHDTGEDALRDRVRLAGQARALGCELRLAGVVRRADRALADLPAG